MVLSLTQFAALGQDTIVLNNPSFEDTPRAGGLSYNIPIKGWHDCAKAVYPRQSPPDIHPHPQAWLVSVDPYDGKTFLGMVVRQDDQESHEFISQVLEIPLKKGECYSFSIHLAQSDTYMGVRGNLKVVRNINDSLYISPDGKDTTLVQYITLDTIQDKTNFTNPFMTPAVLRIWGGRWICTKSELLGSSGPITNRSWSEYKFKFEPSDSLRYITLEAFYDTPVLETYNGHILVDKASAIVQIDCDKDINEEPLEPISIIKAEPVVVEEEVVAAVVEPEVKKEEPVYTPKILSDLDREKIAAGQTIRVKNLYFQADSSRIESKSYPVLDEIKFSS